MSGSVSSQPIPARDLLCSRCYKRESCVQCCGTRFCLRVRSRRGLVLLSVPITARIRTVPATNMCYIAGLRAMCSSIVMSSCPPPWRVVEEAAPRSVVARILFAGECFQMEINKKIARKRRATWRTSCELAVHSSTGHSLVHEAPW